MTNTINKVIRNGTEYEFNAVNGGVTSVNTRTGAVTGLAEDNAVVKLTGNQTVAGTKTFSTSPKVPSKTTDAANTGTAIATEAQVYKKQDKLVSGTNIKTVNNNSLLGSGDLTLNDVKVSTTAPSSPTEGMVWYDTTNDQLKVYDGSQWNVTGKEYQAGTGINIANDTITNSGVTSVNGETGDVTIQSGSEASGVTTEQPSDPVAGSTYFNTTTGTMMVYNGTEWVEVGAGGGIENDTTGTTTTISKVWAGSEDEFAGLSSKTEGVIYNVFGDGGSEGGGGLGEPTLLATITSYSTATQINTSSKWLYIVSQMVSSSNYRAIANLIYVPILNTTQWAYGDYNYSAKVYKDASGNIQVVNKYASTTTYVYEL